MIVVERGGGGDVEAVLATAKTGGGVGVATRVAVRG